MSGEDATVANLVDLDAGVRDAVGAGAIDHARRTLDVRVVHVPAGPWDPDGLELGPRPMGLLLTGGLVLRRVLLGHRASAELLGTGDLLHPEQRTDLPFTADWRVITPAQVAVLDRRAASRLARHPDVLLSFLDREVLRSRRTAERCATAQLGTTDDRLRVELCRLAERWGRIRAEGVLLDLPLTQEMLGHLIGVRRPAVSSALGRLTRAGLVEPLRGGGWLLHFRELAPPAQAGGDAQVVSG